MATDMHDTRTSITGLMGGIIGDAQELIRQQLALFRSEVQQDVRNTKQALIPLVGGALVLQIAAVPLSFMLAYLLHAALPTLPLWSCFGIVGLGMLVGGGLALWLGIARFQSFNPLPDQSARALQENIQWITNRK